MSIFEQFEKSEDKYVFVENLEATLMDLPSMDEIKGMYKTWWGARILVHNGEPYIRVHEGNDFDYALFHHTDELQEYFSCV